MTVGSISSRPILHHGIIPITTLLLLMTRPASAQNSSSKMDSTYPNNYNEPTISLSTGVIILVLILSFLFVGFISLYIRHCSDDDDQARADPGGSVFRARRATARGLDPEAIEELPTFSYAAVKELKIGKHALECAVCLTEFDDDDTLRLLPQCDHVFHPECIDTWLAAHTTCPVCRSDLHAPPPDDARLPHAPPPEQEEERRENDDCSSVEVRRNASFRRPKRLWGRIARSFSTGHVAVKQWENLERFRLRLPEEVRKDVMSGKLQRATSMVVLPRSTSSRRGYRTGFGEGSSRGGARFRSFRSDRSVFSFFSRALSFRTPKFPGNNSSREGSLRGSVRTESTRLPV